MEIDNLIQSTINKAEANQKSDVNFIWKLAGGLVVACLVGWIKYLLTQKSKELAKVKTELEKTKLAASQTAANAVIEASEEKRVVLEKAAAEALMRATEQEAKVQIALDEHNLRWEKIKAVEKNDWETLNRLAGIK